MKIEISILKIFKDIDVPVPDPMAPRASARTERAPIHIPPNQAAVGMYLKLKEIILNL